MRQKPCTDRNTTVIRMSSGRLSSLSTCVGFLLLLSSLGLILGQIIYGQVRVGKDEEWKAYISTFGASWGSDHVAWSLDGDTNGWFHAPPSAPWSEPSWGLGWGSRSVRSWALWSAPSS